MIHYLIQKWIPNFECHGCGSVLGKYRYNEATRRYDKLCFVCCLGEFELTEAETEGETFEEIMVLTGREYGNVEELLPYINTPLSSLSCKQTNPRTDIVNISILNSDLKLKGNSNATDGAPADVSAGTLSVVKEDTGWFSLTSTQMQILNLYTKYVVKKQK